MTTKKIQRVPQGELDEELKSLLNKYPQLAAIRSYQKDEVDLYCTVCKETLAVEQTCTESSELHFVTRRGFRQGKPCVADGDESVRCGCGTEYKAIEEWEPY